jgi:hypothetical protein
MAATKEKVKTEVKKTYGSFLKDQIVDIKPVESSGKWKNLLASGQDMNKSPFLFNKIKRSFQVPLNSSRKGGGVKIILDDNTKVLIKKYEEQYPEGMTERQFFEKEIGVSLNPSEPKEKNFWRTDKRGRVTLTKEGVTLNLNLTMDMLRYKILLSNENLVAPNYDVRKNKQTYEFMVVDQGKLVSRRVEEADLKSKAFSKYAEITTNLTSMISFIKALGRTVPANYTENWLKGEILTVLENSHSNFLSVVEDPNYELKIFIQNATEVGAIKRMNERRYVLDNGIELGDLYSVIQWISDPDHQETKMRIMSQIEMAKK